VFQITFSLNILNTFVIQRRIMMEDVMKLTRRQRAEQAGISPVSSV